jgi:hypothetical protein
MKITQIIEGLHLAEASLAVKIKDPKTIKQIYIAMTHDGTLPGAKLAKLGPKPTPEQTLQLWSDLLDESLSNTRYGNMSVIRNAQGKVIEDGPFDLWLTKLYMNGQANFEDINGEGGDALGAWYVLKSKNKLKPNENQLQNLKSIKAIQTIVNKREYRDELRKIEDAEVIEKHKRERKEITIIDNNRFLVTVPLNYGACYTFNNAHGFNAGFCTGSSSGLRWFNNYAEQGPIVSIFDKKNPDDVNGKWQMHAPTHQLNNGDQQTRGDRVFSEMFPGLMKKIIAGLEQHAEEIKANSGNLVSGGYDIAKTIQDIKKEFPMSVASEPDEPEAKQDPHGPGRYLITQTATGRTKHIDAQSLEDAQQQLLARHPNANLEDFTFKLEQEEPEQDN